MPPIITFNSEIDWIAKVVVPPHTSIEKGQYVLLHQIQEITDVQPPVLDSKPVPFVYLYREGLAYHIVFDFAPNEADMQEGWKFGKAIAESLQQVLIERTVRVQDSLKALLRAHGLWAAPALLPYPLSRIAKQLEEGDTEGRILRCESTAHRNSWQKLHRNGGPLSSSPCADNSSKML